jgi:excisionase family DNA binding protein
VSEAGPVETRLSVRASGGKRVSVALPAEALDALLEVLGQIASGCAVSVVAEDAELTTQQAADHLNVSRPFLIGLLDARAIPYRKVGTHRRVRMSDLLAFKERDDAGRRAVAEELAAEAQKHGLGY